jgi:hypothetical protein
MTRILTRLLFAAGLCLAATGAWAQSGSELFVRMKELLGAEKDFFAEVSLTDDRPGKNSAVGPGPAAQYFFFRSDARPALLLYQTFPAPLSGFAYLMKGDALSGFNPDCGCASETDGLAMRARAGFSFAEINPLSLASYRLVSAAAGWIEGQAALLLDLASPAGQDDGSRVRLSLSTVTGLPLRLEYRDDQGAPQRTVVYLAWFEIGGRFFPRRFRVTDNDGARWTAEVSATSYNPLPDFVFTKAYLQELRQ